MIYLRLKNGKTHFEGKSTQVVRALTIGRPPIADIALVDDKNISRLHALVVPRPDGRLEIRDLSSAAGTFVVERGQKRRLSPASGKEGFKYGRATLSVGESFYIGDYKIDIEYEEVLGEPTLQDARLEQDDDITNVDRLDED